MKTKNLTMTALLTSIAIIIPFAGFLRVYLFPFTATLGAHVPMFISMLLGPKFAIVVGLGSFLGFTLSVDIIVGIRALMHVIVGYVGAKLFAKKISYRNAAIITAPLHGILEALVVLIAIPFTDSKFDLFNILIITGVGTVLHHLVDATISYFVAKPLQASRLVTFTNRLK